MQTSVAKSYCCKKIVIKTSFTSLNREHSSKLNRSDMLIAHACMCICACVLTCIMLYSVSLFKIMRMIPRPCYVNQLNTAHFGCRFGKSGLLTVHINNKCKQLTYPLYHKMYNVNYYNTYDTVQSLDKIALKTSH